MPKEAQTLGELLNRIAESYLYEPALVIYEESLSYQALAERARSIAHRLLGSGLEIGDRVAVWIPNGTAFAELAFGVALAGMVLVPLNTRLKSFDATETLRKSSTQALFFTETFLGIDFFRMVQTIQASGKLPDLRLVINLGTSGSTDIRSWTRWQDETTPAKDLPSVSAEAPAIINFTSGTTSSSKGAVISHGSLLHIAREVGLRMGISQADRMVSAMPFYHNGGFVPTLLTCLMFGCTLYTQPWFDPEYVLNTITRKQCTLVGGVGTMFTMMMDNPALAKADLRSLRAVRITGTADIRRVAYERFGRPMIYSLYGMTESTAAITLTCPDDTVGEQINTNGKPIPGTSLRIVGPNGEDLPPETKGEIWINGKSLMQGYFRDPDATAQVLTSDGWLHSGDLGYVDQSGNLVFVGRIKDMYRCGGENVACPEVEEFLRSHPAVLHADVMGVPDSRLGEVGFAFVELRPSASTTCEELQAFCRENLANFKVPHYIQFRKNLPITASGRVIKYSLLDEALALVREQTD